MQYHQKGVDQRRTLADKAPCSGASPERTCTNPVHQKGP
jgi:hypothetical protein